MLQDTQEILSVMKKKKSRDLVKLMTISQKLADENVLRYANFSNDFTDQNSRPALFAFSGDVYRGIEPHTLTRQQLDYCQSHLRILSGLYGLLKPYDRMQAYRLEMGIPLAIQKHKNLYSFWGNRITRLLQRDLEETNSKFLINLASNEYIESINRDELTVPVINIHFREIKKNVLNFVSYTAKKARGLMVRYMAQNNAMTPGQLKQFDLENYQYAENISSETEWYFVR